MALVPPVLPADVERVGALTPALFQLNDQPSLDALVQFAIDGADAWLQDKAGSNYGLAQFAWQVTQQRNGEIYLSLERLTDTLKAQKTYGTNYPYMSEDSPAYESLMAVDWGQRAMECLDRWVTVERQGLPAIGFAMPLFRVGSPIPEGDANNNGRDPLEVFYSRLLDRARGIANPSIGTVTR